jgi:nucleotide-binding universal stress UspA family protein
MASHSRRGISRLLLGSQTSRVLALADIPVLVCR